MDIATIRQLAAVLPPRQKYKYTNFKAAAEEIARLEDILAVEHGPQIFNLFAANRRVEQLEQLLALKLADTPATPSVIPIAAPMSAPPTMAVPPAPDAAARSQSLADGLTGRARFNASCSRDAAAKPKAKSHPELHGRDRFSADARINALTQILSGNQKPIPAGLTGRKRFAAAVNADFSKE
jgi:hypothetical protein